MNNVRRVVGGVAACIALLLAGLRAQAPTPSSGASRLAFEVVSIKPTAPGAYPRLDGLGILAPQAGGRVRIQNATVWDLLLTVFKTDGGLRAAQILGAPDWVRSSRFDMMATTGTDISREELSSQMAALLRSLLEDRFKLKTHTEKRSQPVYVLVKARSDGRPGRELRRTVTDCEAYILDRRANPQPLRPRLPSEPPPPCDSAGGASGTFSARGYTMRSLAGSLSSAVGRTVLDRTDLSGRFDFDLQFTPDEVRAGLQAAAPGAPADGPSIFTALQEQLGLKLEPREEPLDVFVIDHIEPPTPD